MRRYLPPNLLSAVPAGLVPTAKMGALIDAVEKGASVTLESGGAIHPTLIEALAKTAADKLDDGPQTARTFVGAAESGDVCDRSGKDAGPDLRGEEGTEAK